MRSHAVVVPTFWTRGTGKKLRGRPEVQLLACYLMTSPHTSMVGIFHIALPTIAHEVGMPIEDVKSAIGVLQAEDFAHYDEEEELMYLPAGARTQVGDHLSAGDKRRPQLLRQLDAFGRHRFVEDFHERYRELYGLGALQSGRKKEDLRRGIEGPSKGHVVVADAPCSRAAWGPVPAPASVPDPDPEEGVQGEAPPQRLDGGGRPLPRRPLLPEMLARDRYRPSEVMLGYGRQLGLDAEDLASVLRDLRDKHGLRPHSIDWWDERWLRFAEQAAKRGAGPRRVDPGDADPPAEYWRPPPGEGEGAVPCPPEIAERLRRAGYGGPLAPTGSDGS